MGFFSRMNSRRKTGPLFGWVIPQKLAVGKLPTKHDVEFLEENKIKFILTLCLPREGRVPPEVAEAFYCGFLPLPDSHYDSPIDLENLAKAVEVVHQCIARGAAVFVHCLAGIERSPTVCIAYLCRHHGLELWEAIVLVKKARPQSSPTAGQIQVIRQYLAAVKQGGMP